MSILTFCRWLAVTPLGIAMRDSTWAFAIVEIAHLLALAIFGGSILLVDLRFFNLGLKTQSVSRVARELLPLTAGGVVVMLISGVLMVANGPVRYYYNPAFRIKLVLFTVALVVHFALQVWAARGANTESAGQQGSSIGPRIAAAASLVLWLSIGVAGRAIGYV